MKLLPTLSLALAVLAAAGPAGAGCTSRTLGSTVFHACDDGRTGTSRTIGNTTFHEFDGQRGMSRTFGTTTFHDFDGRSDRPQATGSRRFPGEGGAVETALTGGGHLLGPGTRAGTSLLRDGGY